MEGFKVICLKCNREYIIKIPDDISSLIYATGYHGEVGIGCDYCNNLVQEEY